MSTMAVPRFLPSRNGFAFANRFPPVPVIRIPLGRRTLGIGSASDGLCGGMTFAAADLFVAGRLPPQDVTEAPGSGPLLRYLVKRAYHSLNVPAGPVRYAWWSILPDADSTFGFLDGLATRTRVREWPRVRADVDAGRPCPLGLIRVHSANPRRLVLNHQVLAYGYQADDVTGRLVAVRVYDPNHPGDDSMAITVTPGGFAYVAGEPPVRGFFRSRYRPSNPIAVAGPSFGPAPGRPAPDDQASPATTG
jgi:hypothetical protein